MNFTQNVNKNTTKKGRRTNMITYETREVKVKQVVSYGGHNITANGLVNLTLKADYSELVNSIQVTQLINNDVTIVAKINGKAQNLGIFRVKSIDIAGDGTSKIKFVGDTNYVETDLINSVPLNTDDVKEFKVLYKADVEYEVEVDEETGEVV